MSFSIRSVLNVLHEFGEVESLWIAFDIGDGMLSEDVIGRGDQVV